MITNFLHSLIARHQEDNIATGIQPRPKARFEDLSAPSPLAGNELHRNFEREVTPVFTQEQNFPSPPRPSPFADSSFAPQRSIESPLLQKNLGDNAPPINLSEQIVPLLPRRSFAETAFAPRHTINQPILQKKQNSHDAQPVQPAAEFPAFQQTLTAQQTSLERNQAVPAASPFAENLDQRIQQIVQRLNVDSVGREHANPLHVQEGFAEKNENANFPNKVLPELSANAESKKGQPILAGESNQRIQEMLHRLTIPQPQSRFEPPPIIEPLQQQPTPFQPYKDRARKTQSSPPPTASAPGLLQLPGWLTDMQADLRSRWQESSSPVSSSAPEPVINVTIGRVEVRAMQPQIHSGPKTRPQLSGIMSLDDYLKQRENRR
jgi:hypothetical protein